MLKLLSHCKLDFELLCALTIVHGSLFIFLMYASRLFGSGYTEPAQQEIVALFTT